MKYSTSRLEEREGINPMVTTIFNEIKGKLNRRIIATLEVIKAKKGNLKNRLLIIVEELMIVNTG